MSDKKNVTKPRKYSPAVEKEFMVKIERLSQLGHTWGEMSYILWPKLTEGTKQQLKTFEEYLKKRFRIGYEKGRAHMKSRIRSAQIDLAVNEKNATMLVWLGKQYLYQSDLPAPDSEDEGFEFV